MAERTRRPSPPGAVQRDFEEKTLGEQVADLSEDVLESVRDRQQTVIEAMRNFVDRLDEALPDLGEERRKKVLDALVDFAEKLGTTTNEFAAKMVRSASGTLKEGTAKPAAEGTAKPAAD
ncbi:MAG: hypothetical protein ACXVGA_08870 [Mycobacteriaceae bacterium]